MNRGLPLSVSDISEAKNLTNELVWLSAAARTRKLFLCGGIKATKAETMPWEPPLLSHLLTVLHPSLLSLCPQMLSSEPGQGEQFALGTVFILTTPYVTFPLWQDQ